MMDQSFSTTLEGHTIKIVNEDDHPIRFELCNKKRWILPNDEWEVFVDPNIDVIEDCKAWFNGEDKAPMTFNIWEDRDAQFIVRKDKGIYIANLDGTDEEMYIEIDVVQILESEMADLHCESVCKVKIVNEDDHEILFKIDEYEQWLAPNEEFEVTIDHNLPSTTGLCKAYFNGEDDEPWEFYVGDEKDVKYMVRKDDGIYQSDYDGTNEKIFEKIFLDVPEEEPIPSVFDSAANDLLRSLNCKLMIENQDDHEILFEFSHVQFPSKKTWIDAKHSFVFEYDPYLTTPWICEAWFNGVNEKPIVFEIFEHCDVKLMIRKNDGIYIARFDGSDEECFLRFKIVPRIITNVDDTDSSDDTDDSEEDDDEEEEGLTTNITEKYCIAENNNEIVVENTKYTKIFCVAEGNGVPPMRYGIVLSKRKLEASVKWEEEPLHKKRKFVSFKDF